MNHHNKQWLGPYYSGVTYKSVKEAKEAYQHYQLNELNEETGCNATGYIKLNLKSEA